MTTRKGIIKYADSILLIGLWLIVFVVPLIVFPDNEGFYWKKVAGTWFSILPFFIIFLINNFVLVPYLLFGNRKKVYLLSVIITVLGFSLLLHYIEQVRIRNNIALNATLPPPHKLRDSAVYMEKQPPPPGNNAIPFPYPPAINSAILCLLIIGFNTGLRMVVRWSNLEKEQAVLEKQNTQNMLAFLRNQISPHFFMNTLNNIHVLIDINTEEAKEAVIKLSKLMRHLLYDSESELVYINKEIDFIISYINLMKLRFSEKVVISLNIPDGIPNKKVPPLLFTSFVENAFKHGISYQEHSFITINFKFEESKLVFEITNRIQKVAMDDKDSGIGIENSIKRLDLLYGNNYSLTVDEEDEIYNLKLSIPL